jgi:bla regulator protein BlaR1
MTYFTSSHTIEHFRDSFLIMLLHSLWQGVLFASIGALFLFVNKLSSKWNYIFLLGLCILFVLTCSLTFWWQYQYDDSIWPVIAHQIANQTVINNFLQDCIAFITIHSKIIFLVWLICFSLYTIKILVHLFYFNSIKKFNVIKPSLHWKEKTELLSKKLGIHTTVKLLESAMIKVPIVLGHFKPVILLPLGALTNLPSMQIEAILAHELAHIRRADYLVNLIQNIVEAIFFFNPGFLILSNWLRSQRENCCDDIAIKHSNTTKDYLLALVEFKGNVIKNNYQLSFIGANNGLLNRVSRILGKPYNKFSTVDRSLVAISIFILVGLIGLTVKKNTIQSLHHPKTSKITIKQLQNSSTTFTNTSSSSSISVQPSLIRKKNVQRISNQTKEIINSEIIASTVATTPILTEKTGVEKILENRKQVLARYETAIVKYDKDVEKYKTDIEKYEQLIKQYEQLKYLPTKETYPN